MVPSQLVPEDQQSLLAKFVINNPDLEKLESLLSEFNLFEAVGMVRQELQHSNLLAFLLTPSERHGLGDRFLKKLLISAFSNAQNVLCPIAIDVADLMDVEVRREWRNIDLLIYSPSNHWVIAIENKVDSGEHSGQLHRYEKTVEKEFSTCQKAFIYLTKEGDVASSPKWRQLSYGKVADLLEAVQIKHRSSLSDDVQMLISHYISLIRRHFVNESEIAQLCRKIYKQHYQAIDLIYGHRPDMQLQIADFLQEMIKEEAELKDIELDDSNKYWVRFAPKAWDITVPNIQKTCKGWTNSHRLVLFEFVITNQKLVLNLVIGPGKKEHKEVMYGAIKSSSLLTVRNTHLISDKWSIATSRPILGKTDYVEKDWDALQKKIRRIWQTYVHNELPAIAKAISAIDSTPGLPLPEKADMATMAHNN